MTLTRRLVGLHGGTIEVSSVPGHGTTVTVHLPRDRILRRGSGLTDEPATPPLDILLVEDDAVTRLTTQMMLTRRGHRVICAAHANEALEILQSEQPVDLLFSDIVIPPGMSGAELAKVAERLRPVERRLSKGERASGALDAARLDSFTEEEIERMAAEDRENDWFDRRRGPTGCRVPRRRRARAEPPRSDRRSLPGR